MLKPGRLTLILLAALSWPVAAQTFDNTGDKLLNGTYYFREVIYDLDSGLSAVVYGTINFNGIGTYSISGTEGDTSSEELSPYSTSGNYSISASGFGFVYNSLLESNIYGSVSANGVFIGSATESGYNDLFIAAPVSGQSTGTLNGSYSIAYLDVGLVSGSPFDALLQMTPNGAGTIGTVNISAYQTSSTPSTQAISGIKYTASNSAFVLTFPNNNNNYIVGQEYLYSSPDGSFVFGGAPNYFDMFVGVRNGSSGNNFGGLYYQAGIDEDVSQLASDTVGLDSYYGAFSALGGTLIGHERVLQADSSAFGYTFDDSYPQGSNGSYNDSFTSAQYFGGDGGTVRVGLGIGPSLSISVAVTAPSFSGSGVYINPTGVVNAANFAPFTAGISPGEFISIFGTNIGPSQPQSATTLPLPMELGNVQVLINNIAAPIDYVSADQISVIVPYEISTSVAQIQVVYNGSYSNAVTELVNMTTPGIFTNQPEGGTGYAAALHQDFSLVTEASPAQIGETISVFVSGLGSVFPSILDGAAGPSGTLSTTSNTIMADISGTAATIGFAGLAPGLAGLYQINVQIPSGLTAGDNFLDIGGPDSYTSEAIIPIGSGGLALTRPSRADTLRSRHAPKYRLQKNSSYRLRSPE